MAPETAVPPPLSAFHPIIATWFQSRLGDPTPVQTRAWPAIRQGTHTLIAAPTGSGKTLAAFLTILDDLLKRGVEGDLPAETLVVYVSPLKALSNDVEKNLNRPLREIQDALFHGHLQKVDIRVAVRTGDTPTAERAAMVKRPPHILITTPESLFLLLTSRLGRNMLSTVKTVIVDEIHALVAEKRGAHLALSLERLQALAGDGLVRIGLSATQKPIEEVARFLVGGAAGSAPGPVNQSWLTAHRAVRASPAAQMHASAGYPQIEEGAQERNPASVAAETGPALDPAAPISCTIIDAGHRRRMDLAVEIPESPLTAVMAGEVWEEVYARIEALIAAHRTTLLFVNTRRLAERVAHRLSQTLGEDKIAAHHGSLSKDRRFDAEQRLKSGSLQCLVATASLELGIDIGSVDLVIQIGNPKSISALLQRVGRSGHAVGALPKGRLFPLTLTELAESASLLDAVRRGELDTLSIPAKPLEILAQQITAETACREWSGRELFETFRRAYPYRDLSWEEFQEIVGMLSQGFTTRRGRRGAHLHHDGVNDCLRGRPGARLTALTNGGAIPDTFDYEVKLEPGNTLLGSVNEDFAIDSMPGDIFQLGNNSWQILRVEGSTVRVADAHGQPPTIPFWFGEAPGRSDAFSGAVSRLRLEIGDRLGETALLQERAREEGSGPGAPWKQAALAWLADELGLQAGAAEQLVDYLASSKLALGVLPSRDTLVLERFFDAAGDMHMVLHSPFGSRINRAWGLALRKRFCRKFNFELQAAATEDSLILSLGATHSFPLEEVYQYLKAGLVRPILVQALLDAPMFEVRWRWNATRALAVLRNRNGKKVPPQLQRMASEDLVALVFPDQKACFENIQGEREIPDHPLVRQTIDDCLHEAMDIDGLEKLLAEVEAGRLNLLACDLKEPSPLAQEVINARPYAFLDDAPLEERRTRAIQARRWIDPAEAGDLGRLDPQAIAAVRAEAWPQARNADELHDALTLTGFLTESEMAREAGWADCLETLRGDNRVACITARPGAEAVWVAAERLAQALRALPGAAVVWQPRLSGLSSNWGYPPKAGVEPESEEDALREILRGRLESLGPVRGRDLAESLGIADSRAEFALLALEQEGFVLRGRFTPAASVAAASTSVISEPTPHYELETLEPGAPGQEGIGKIQPATRPTEFSSIEWCERRLLARIHRYTLARLRKEIEPVSTSDYLRFLFSWQGLDDSRLSSPESSGPRALEAVLARLEGFEAPCTAWEKDILPARMDRYDPAWLDMQCLSGQYIWGRVRPGRHPGLEGRKPGPVKATPIAFLSRESLDLWLEGPMLETPSPRGEPAPDADGLATPRMGEPAEAVLEYLRNRGASFWREILRATGLAPETAREAVAELVAMGWVTADGFQGMRSLVHAKEDLDRSGRWTLLRGAGSADAGKPGAAGTDPAAGARKRLSRETGLEMLARVLLRRYGVVFRKLADRESLAPPWRDLVRAFRLLEARGEVRGGRFVEGFYGEQFALPEAVGRLRQLRKHPSTPGSAGLVCLSAADPANLQGILTPGPRIPAIRKNRVLYRDGHPVAAWEGGETRFLTAETAGEMPREWVKALRAGLPGLAEYATMITAGDQQKPAASGG